MELLLGLVQDMSTGTITLYNEDHSVYIPRRQLEKLTSDAFAWVPMNFLLVCTMRNK